MKNVHLGRGLTLVLLLALGAIFVSGCSSGYDGADAAKTSSNSGLPPLNSKRLDLVEADLKMRVPNVQKSEKEIGRILQTAGGYVESATSGDLASRHPTMTMSLKIPAANVASAIEGLEALGTPTAKTVSMQDVTDSSPLTKGAPPAKPPLATVNLSLEQSIAAEVGGDPEWLSQAWSEALSNAAVVYRTLLVGLVWLLVFLPLWGPGLWIYRKYGQRLRKPPVAA